MPDSFYVSFIYADTTFATVQWVLQGQGMTYTIPVTYTFGSYGTYVIVLTLNCNSYKNLVTYMTYVNFNESLGIPETPASTASVYPNPFSNTLNIDQPDGIRQIDVYNNLGQQIYTMSDDGNTHLSLDASDWKPGTFMIRILTEKGQTSTIVIKK